MVNEFRASLRLLLILIASSAPGQPRGSLKDKPSAPGLIKLTGDDAKRAEELDKAIDREAPWPPKVIDKKRAQSEEEG